MAEETDKPSPASKPKKPAHVTAGAAQREAVPPAGEEVEQAATVEGVDTQSEESRAVGASSKEQELPKPPASIAKATPPPQSETSKPSNLAEALRFHRKHDKRRR